jgi:hypothetical protein
VALDILQEFADVVIKFSGLFLINSLNNTPSVNNGITNDPISFAIINVNGKNES